MPRNRTRAERAALGLVDLSVSLPVHLRDAIDIEAQAQGVSRAALVAKWAKKLAKKHGLKKTTPPAK